MFFPKTYGREEFSLKEDGKYPPNHLLRRELSVAAGLNKN
jgi:hypothetical protein